MVFYAISWRLPINKLVKFGALRRIPKVSNSTGLNLKAKIREFRLCDILSRTGMFQNGTNIRVVKEIITTQKNIPSRFFTKPTCKSKINVYYKSWGRQRLISLFVACNPHTPQPLFRIAILRIVK